jgi:hypothetical protein
VFAYRVITEIINRGIITVPPLIEIKGLAASIAEAKKGTKAPFPRACFVFNVSVLRSS